MNKEDVKMKKPNDDIRLLARTKGVYLWQVAEQLKISEPTLMRWLRKPLTEDKKQAIIDAINKIAEETYTTA
jgi:transposase-like protein